MIQISPVPVTGPPRTVSVVIPNYNYARFLPECLDSVLSQTGIDLDVVVVDDCSTDNSVEIVTRYARDDARVRLVRHTTNQGHIGTFNHALQSARAEFVVKLDADDVLAPGSLQRSSDLLAHFGSVAFVYGRPVAFHDSVPTQPVRPPVRSWSVWSGEEWIASRVRRGHNAIMQPEVMIRRSCLERVGGHRADIPEASDFNLWMRLATVGSVGRVNGPAQGFYRIHSESMQRTIHAGKLSDLNARWRALELFFQECGKSIPGLDQLQSTARQTLARDAVRLAAYAYDTGTEDLEPVKSFMTFAAELDPAVSRRPAHAAVRLRGALSDRRYRLISRRVPGAAIRDVEDRLRWRYWQRYGL